MNVVIFVKKDDKLSEWSELTGTEQKNISIELNKQALASLGYTERRK